MADYFPRTLKLAFKLTGINSNYIEFTVCPCCSSTYTYNNSYVLERGLKMPKKCPYVRFPNHLHLARRVPCGNYLMKEGKGRKGSIILRPFKVFAYQSLKGAMTNLINRPGFLSLCEHWRDRHNDIYWETYMMLEFGKNL